METASVKITRSRMRELSKQGQKAAARRNLDLATQAAVTARALVPVDTGDLKSTIRVEQNLSTGTAALIAGGPADSGREVNYAAFVELGTIHSAAQPFLKPAVELALKRSKNRKAKLYT
jgi:HK97 gp10 family phage protein